MSCFERRSRSWDSATRGESRLGGCDTLERDTAGDIVPIRRLRAVLGRLNLGLSPEAALVIVEEITRDRSALSLVQANREVYGLLKNGVKVTIRAGGDEDESVSNVRLIDWGEPFHNDFLLASQLWVSGEVYRRRVDLVGFVNGIPSSSSS
jgi:type I restriction enzyme, R subunit